MEELQGIVVQHQSSAGVRLCAIFLVTRNGAAQVAHMNADLVLSACQQLDVHLAVVAHGLQHLVACHRELALLGVVGRIHLHRLVFSQVAPHLAFRLGRASLHDGHVHSLHHVGCPRVAEHLLHLGVLRKDQDARSVLVEAMANVGMRMSVLGIHIVIDDLLGSLLTLVGPRGYGQQSRLLLDHHDVVVLPDHAGHAALQGGEGSCEVDYQLVIVLELFVKLRGHLSVVHHVAMLQVTLDFGSTFRRQRLHQEGQKLAGLVDSVHLYMVGAEASWSSFRIVSFHPNE